MYESLLGSLDLKAEKEFSEKVAEVAMYQGDIERYTLDNEWSEDELREDLEDEAMKLLHGTSNSKGWLAETEGRAKIDPDLDFTEYLVNKVLDEYDIIEEYNKQVDKHRNDADVKFGIHYFDEWCIKVMKKILKNNLVTK